MYSLKLFRTFSNFMHNVTITFRRRKTSLGLWHEDVNRDIKIKIEKYWSNEVLHREISNADPVYYVLPMFPYPSGNLHMGHVRVYSISDALTRFHKLNGYKVIHPIGWDAFGLPAENAAIERNIPPYKWTKSNIEKMKQQLLQLGFEFDWTREISTCNPHYYKWTQYIFLKLLENGLAYQCKAEVNWDPVDQTVLADEQVDDLGCSWRSGVKVEKKLLTQWFIKTTKYAKKLLDGLKDKSLENWKDIINLQRHWIGDCDGTVVTFKLNVDGTMKLFDVWTKNPYKYIHGTFIVMKSSHPLLQGHTYNSGLSCLNPITDSEMPVYMCDTVEYPEGRDVLIACPTQDETDNQIAQALQISIDQENKKDIAIESDSLKAIEIATNKNVGGHFVSSKLKDWLISRQRYWGTPIPIIYCPKCNIVPVPYEDLPVVLPELDTHSGIQTLQSLDNWVNCKCPKCHSNAKRETDTMDTFVDSSWYFYRFLDPKNEFAPFNKEKLKNSTPVDIYIGGKEHAVLHLYYARFMSYFLNSLGMTYVEEPFKKLLVQGMVMGQSYKVKSSGKYLPPENVEKVGEIYKEKVTGEPVLVQWEKMSKSKYNGENPERLLESYGCDMTRLLILADVPPGTPRRWSDATLPGCLNWQHRLWMTMREFLKYRANNFESNSLSPEEFKEIENKIWENRNYFTATTTYHFRDTQKLSVGISRLQSLTSTLRNNIPPEVYARSKEFELALAALIIMASPITPHFCSELWAGLLSAPHRISSHNSTINWENNVLEQNWPVVDDHYKLSFLCKVDGADRCELKIKAAELNNLHEERALQVMLNEESVQKWTRRGVLRQKYELYPGCRAILHIFTNKKQKQVEEV